MRYLPPLLVALIAIFFGSHFLWVRPFQTNSIQTGPAPTASTHDGCTLTPAATFYAMPNTGIPIIAAQIDGEPVTLMLDTGSNATILTSDSASKLGLPADPQHSSTISGLATLGNPERVNPDAEITSYTVGSASIPLQRLDTGLTLPPAIYKTGQPIPDGIMGDDALSGLDLDLDLPEHRITFWQESGCHGRYMPWTNSYQLFQSGPDTPPTYVPATVADVPVSAKIDTGTTTTTVNAAITQDLPQSLSASFNLQTPYDATGQAINATTATLNQLAIGEIQEPPLKAYLIDNMPEGMNMLIGQNYLARHHVWISYPTRETAIETTTPGS